jgi:hypothetical protein
VAGSTPAGGVPDGAADADPLEPDPDGAVVDAEVELEPALVAADAIPAAPTEAPTIRALVVTALRNFLGLSFMDQSSPRVSIAREGPEADASWPRTINPPCALAASRLGIDHGMPRT